MAESKVLVNSSLPYKDSQPSRVVLWMLTAPLVVLVILANVGDALAPSLVDKHPLLLIALNARNRNLALVTNQLGTTEFYLVGFIRLVISDPLFYILGWYYGDAAVRWVEGNTNTLGNTLRFVEKHFRRFGIPLVFAMPNNWICLFAGASKMRPWVFLTANITGTLARLYALRVLGNVFSGPLDWLLEQIAKYRTPLLILSITLVVFTVWSERKRDTGELAGITKLAEELGDIDPSDRVVSAPYEPESPGTPTSSGDVNPTAEVESAPDAGTAPTGSDTNANGNSGNI